MTQESHWSLKASELSDGLVCPAGVSQAHDLKEQGVSVVAMNPGLFSTRLSHGMQPFDREGTHSRRNVESVTLQSLYTSVRLGVCLQIRRRRMWC